MPDGGSADAAEDAPADAGLDVTTDAAADGGSCPVKCVTNAIWLNGQPAAPNGGDATYCKGGCTWYTPGIETGDYRNVCHTTCGGVCAADPPYGGICPAECTGGCADGVCSITCDGSDPALSCKQVFAPAPHPALAEFITKPIVRCPNGMPCKVTCRNDGCAQNIIACPRDQVSCEIDCGFAPDGGCLGSQLYCGSGRCNVRGETPGAGVPRNVNYPEYNLPHDVCGESCSCSLPYRVIVEGAHVRCQCKDGTTLNSGNGGGGIYGAPVCPARCAAHGGWSAPWERTPFSW